MRGLPIALEEIAFGKITARSRRHAFQLAHRFADRASLSTIDLEVRLMTGEPGKSRRVFAGDDREREGADHVRVHRRVPRGRYCFFRSSGQLLLEMELDWPMPGGGEQGVRERAAPV